MKKSDHISNHPDGNNPQDEEMPVVPACMNCGTSLTGNFCFECGQKASTKRLSYRAVLSALSENLLGLESRLLHTLIDLTIRPGVLIRDYVNGSRIPYINPFRLYLFIVAVNFALVSLVGSGMGSEVHSNEESSGDNFVQLQISLVFAVLILPISLGLRLFHYRDDYNFTEHYTFVLYVLTQSVLYMILFDLIALLFTGEMLHGDAEGIIFLAAFSIYMLWAGRVFYKHSLLMMSAAFISALVISLMCLMVISLFLLLFTDILQL